MPKILFAALMLALAVSGCGASGKTTAPPAETASVSGSANAFNPYMQSKLPNVRELSPEGKQMLGKLGGSPVSIEGEAAHRRNWRDEIYPVVFGEKTAPHEIIVVLNFSEPACQDVWKAVLEAAKSLSPAQCKIVVYGRSRENYGTDLMGLAIWLSHSRPGQAMPFLTHALSRWNAVKAAQKKSGQVREFTNEYDATATAQDYPIHYAYLSRLNPPIPASQELSVAKYCYDAGNVNMYQAVQVCQYYGVSSLPAVIVDGRVLGRVTAANILEALK